MAIQLTVIAFGLIAATIAVAGIEAWAMLKLKKAGVDRTRR